MAGFMRFVVLSHSLVVTGVSHPFQDPHPGNLLIRPAAKNSKSPYNFEIVLLDHGLYFDLDSTLRVNYAKLWLSLIAPASQSTITDRRKYAALVGNIGADLVGYFVEHPATCTHFCLVSRIRGSYYRSGRS